MIELCAVCGGQLTFPHDHKPDNSGLDDGPEFHRVRTKPAPKSPQETQDIRSRAWATRRQKYGKYGHR